MRKYFQDQIKTSARHILVYLDFFLWFRISWRLRYYPGLYSVLSSHLALFPTSDTVSLAVFPGIQNQMGTRAWDPVTLQSWVQERSIPAEVNTMQLLTVWWWNAWPRISMHWSGNILGLKRSSSSRLTRCTSGQVMYFLELISVFPGWPGNYCSLWLSTHQRSWQETTASLPFDFLVYLIRL